MEFTSNNFLFRRSCDGNVTAILNNGVYIILNSARIEMHPENSFVCIYAFAVSRIEQHIFMKALTAS